MKFEENGVKIVKLKHEENYNRIANIASMLSLDSLHLVYKGNLPFTAGKANTKNKHEKQSSNIKAPFTRAIFA